MNINKILFEVGISSPISYKELVGGRDSSVYEIDAQDGTSYALRILPSLD